MGTEVVPPMPMVSPKNVGAGASASWSSSSSSGGNNIDYINANKNFIRTFYSPNKFKDVLRGFQIPHPALEILENLVDMLRASS